MREFKQAYPLEDILGMIGPWGRDIDGDYIRLGGLRLFIFKTHGVKCVSCGIEGSFFRKERDLHSTRFFLQLYAVAQDGSIVLMTKDHIKPVSKGGKNYAGNLQTMCAICNSNKGDQWIDMPIQEPIVRQGQWDRVRKPKPVYADHRPTETQIAREKYYQEKEKNKFVNWLHEWRF